MGCGAARPQKSRYEASDPLEYIQRLICSGEYMLSEHTQEGLASGEYSRADIESSVLPGSIRRSAKDEEGQSVGGRKYVITGPSSAGMAFETVGKVIESGDGRKYFFITAYGRH